MIGCLPKRNQAILESPCGGFGGKASHSCPSRLAGLFRTSHTSIGISRGSNGRWAENQPALSRNRFAPADGIPLPGFPSGTLRRREGSDNPEASPTPDDPKPLGSCLLPIEIPGGARPGRAEPGRTEISPHPPTSLRIETGESAPASRPLGLASTLSCVRPMGSRSPTASASVPPNPEP